MNFLSQKAKKNYTSSNKGCKSCSLIEECIFIYEEEQDKCECQECIVKVTCRHLSCDRFDKLVNEIRENIRIGMTNE